MVAGMLNASEKSAFTITTSKIVPAPSNSTKASNITVNNTTTDVAFLLDGVYFEPSRSQTLQYFDREKGVLFKWIQVCIPRRVSDWGHKVRILIIWLEQIEFDRAQAVVEVILFIHALPCCNAEAWEVRVGEIDVSSNISSIGQPPQAWIDICSDMNRILDCPCFLLFITYGVACGAIRSINAKIVVVDVAVDVVVLSSPLLILL